MSTNAEATKENADAVVNNPKVQWDESKMQSTYANVANVSFTREEVVLLFGMNQAWQRGQEEVTVQLTNRVILGPFAAKRLTLLLASVVAEYEKRFGALDLEARAGGGATSS